MSRKKKATLSLPDSNRHDLERKLGHIFLDPNLLWEALQAAGNGVVKIGDCKIEDGNKKMAILGDTILRPAVPNDWHGSRKPRSEFLSASLILIQCLLGRSRIGDVKS